eukprot:CAMPEP_0119037678 /NCGR_PEP_ID=MMETSP1177-20130426/6176_1 /TAXON_ID=2985 /ORGANISM="Ochromonas sp, Strain CCMP1899" /LENGTH=146 /DNA_ID=CAMNT_0006999281 /DNA_START=1 /DNA_END=442 /DNA_ORIENTATION=+
MSEGSDKDESDNDNNSNYDHNDHNVFGRVDNDPNLLGSIFGDDESDDDDNNNNNEGKAASKLLNKKYVMKTTIKNGQGIDIELQLIFLVLRNETAHKDDGVLMAFLDRASLRKLCDSVSKNNNEIDMNRFTRLIEQSTLSPILKFQ